MSPKVSRPAPDDEPEESGLPPGHVPMRRVGPRPTPHKRLSPRARIAGSVVVLGAIVGLIVYLVLPEDPRSSAEGTAELFATAVSEGDPEAYQSYLCRDLEILFPGRAKLGQASVLAVRELDNGLATATVTFSRNLDTEMVLGLEDKDDTWCVFAPDFCPVDEDPYSGISESPLSLCGSRPH